MENQLLAGIDIAKRRHVVQVRLGHARYLDKQLGIPITRKGFDRFWVHFECCRSETGVSCGSSTGRG